MDSRKLENESKFYYFGVIQITFSFVKVRELIWT